MKLQIYQKKNKERDDEKKGVLELLGHLVFV